MENLRNKYKLITHDKELSDIKGLAVSIGESEWFQPLKHSVILVNCFPEYSSILTQQVNHRLSYLNNNELLETINLSMPYPNMNQVWDEVEKDYRNYIRYLTDWTRRHVKGTNKYLFISTNSAGTNLTRVNAMIRGRIDAENYRFAVLYKEKNNILNPDFYVEEYEKNLAFHWENLDNSNWNNAKQDKEDQQH